MNLLIFGIRFRQVFDKVSYDFRIMSVFSNFRFEIVLFRLINQFIQGHKNVTVSGGGGGI